MSRRTLPRSSPRPAETIFALSSGRPPAAVSVIRISGPAAHAAAERLAGRLPKPRTAALRKLVDPGSGEALDDALVLRFDSPASASGEDVVEFQCHGGRAIVDAVLARLAEQPGLRPAMPGEFTRRAFENGRIDLTQAEGLADLIEAETETQRKAALAVAEGGLRGQVEEWRTRLVDLSARAERLIDYADEDEQDETLAGDCATLAAELGEWLARPRAELLKDGLRVVVAGPPNSGKSSLINAIAGFERTIVSDVPGTTRDHIDVSLSLAGVPILLTDTAGLREGAEEIEAIGIARARGLIDAADLLLWLGDGPAPDHRACIGLHAKADLPGRAAAPADRLAISARNGSGLDELLERMRQSAGAVLPGEDALALNRRQAAHLAAAANAIRQVDSGIDAAIIAEALRQARIEFDALSGRAGIENVLDSLFSRFCLGK